MSKRCCIIGGGGYFGQHIARQMQKDGYHTVLLDLTFVEIDRDGFSLDEKKTTRIKGSLMDEATLEKAIKKSSLCFHIAAYGMAAAAALDSRRTFTTNVDGTMLVLIVCNRLHCRRIVFASSVGVIFTDEPLDMVEEDHPKPDKYYSYYSESKSDAEQFVRQANGDRLHTVCLRFRGIFGPGEKTATDRAAESIQSGLYCFKIEKTRNVFTQFSGVDNCAQACSLAAKALFEKPEVVGGNSYTIVDGGDPVRSWEFWDPLVKALNRRPPSIQIPYNLVNYFLIANEFFFMMTGWFPPMINRLELNLMAITNTYSIERARRDLGYSPTNNHDLTEVCKYYSRRFERSPLPFTDYPSILHKIMLVSLLVLSILLCVFIARFL